MIVRNHFAIIRNLRNILEADVSDYHMEKVRRAFNDPSWSTARLFPYRFVVAAKHAPSIEDAIEIAMFKAVEGMERLPGKTGLLIDVSGSMDYRLNTKGAHATIFTPSHVAGKEETSRIDVAAGLAILLREKAESAAIATFSQQVVEVPPRRGFALRDAIYQSQEHQGTFLRAALNALAAQPAWRCLDRLIVITDEQSQDGIAEAWIPRSYVVNVAPNKNGVSYRNGWTHVDGWSERVIDYVREIEALEAA